MAMSMRRGRQPGVLPEAASYGLWNDIRFAARLIARYWSGSDRIWAWGVGGSLAALVGGAVYAAVLLNSANRTFYDALTNRNPDAFLIQSFVLAGVLALVTAVAILRDFLRQLLEIRWRSSLVERYLDRWLRDDDYHRQELCGAIENPDQRIQEDVTLAVRATIKLVIEGTTSAAMLVSFGLLLWRQSEPWHVDLGAAHFTVVAPFVWLGLAYALVGACVTHLSGRALTRTNVRQQRFEADFRHALIRVRDHSEAIALYNGGSAERVRLGTAFDRVRHNWHRIMGFTLRVNLVSGLYIQAIGVLPTFLSAPRYFAGRMSFGGLMQIGMTFAQFVMQLSWFTNSYAEIAEWRSYIERLHRLEDMLAAPLPHGAERRSGGADFVARDLRLMRPDGEPLAMVPDLRIAPGARVLVRGRSGLGKSTLLRSLAGLWPWSTGEIVVPGDARVLFLPQRGYLPEGSLAAALVYPAQPSDVLRASMQRVLRDTQLGDLVDRLDEVRDWARSLSPGEQQRLAVARALLQAPDFLFLDEATSALDPSLERLLYELISDRLPSAAIVSVAHREAVARYHDFVLDFTPGEDGVVRLQLAPLGTSPSTQDEL